LEDAPAHGLTFSAFQSCLGSEERRRKKETRRKKVSRCDVVLK
jgi:hypothetical protein